MVDLCSKWPWSFWLSIWQIYLTVPKSTTKQVSSQLRLEISARASTKGTRTSLLWRNWPTSQTICRWLTSFLARCCRTKERSKAWFVKVRKRAWWRSYKKTPMIKTLPTIEPLWPVKRTTKSTWSQTLLGGRLWALLAPYLFFLVVWFRSSS